LSAEAEAEAGSDVTGRAAFIERSRTSACSRDEDMRRLSLKTNFHHDMNNEEGMDWQDAGSEKC